MKIALLGYGKMGKAIEQLAVSKGDHVVLKVDANNVSTFSEDKLREAGAEVSIDFSSPDAAFQLIMTSLKAGVPVVSGTTAWLDRLPEVIQYCEDNQGAFFYASNYSMGVNLFFRLNAYLAKMMKDFPEFEVRLEEIHHTEKLDAPSGTAITLAEGVIEALDRKTTWVKESASKADQLSISSKREPNVPGTHLVKWDSEIDEITISHVAKSRTGFVKGALMAARWLKGRQGYFTMNDLLPF